VIVVDQRRRGRSRCIRCAAGAAGAAAVPGDRTLAVRVAAQPDHLGGAGGVRHGLSRRCRWWAAPFIDPFEDAHALAAIAHDVGYAIGEPGRRALWDDCFLERMELDGVWPVRRRLMFRAVRLGGGGGYARAEAEWAESFAAADGAPCAPPFAREQGFFGRAHGPQALPSDTT
jgi:hypothetical protein